MWHRYVDDVLVVWPHEDQLLEEFHRHLNKQNPSIQLTVEKESEGKIAFFDAQLEKKGTKVLTSIFHKKTHTDLYLHFDSNHPAKVKRGIIQCLRHRAKKVCDGSTQWQEIRHLVFKPNSYFEAVVERNLRARPTSADSSQALASPQALASQPPSSCYFRTSQDSCSERIERVCRPLGVKTVCKSRGTLWPLELFSVSEAVQRRQEERCPI